MTEFTKGEWVVDGAGDVIIKSSGGGVGYPARSGTIASLNDGEYIENTNEHDMYKMLDDLVRLGEALLSSDEITDEEDLATIHSNFNDKAIEAEVLLKRARGE